MKELTVRIRAEITNIFHDTRNKESTIYLGWGVGKNEVRITRPMRDKYLWSEDGYPVKNKETIKTGDILEIILRKVKKRKEDGR